MTPTDDPHPCVVVGFDGSAASHVALARAIDRVGSDGRLYVVHAWNVPETWRGSGTYQRFEDAALEGADAIMAEALQMHPDLPTSAGRAS